MVVPPLIGLFSALVTTLADVEMFNFQSSTTNPLTPHPATFAIWGVVFVFLALFVVYQLRTSAEEVVWAVNIWFSLSVVSAMLWYWCWSLRWVEASVLSMWLFLGTIAVSYYRLAINLQARSKLEFWSVSVGWSLYIGWVTVATLVHTMTGLLELRLLENDLVRGMFLSLTLVLATVIYLGLLFYRNDPVVALVGLWAFLGILVNHMVGSTEDMLVIILSLSGLVALGVGQLFYLLKNRRSTLHVSEH